MSVVGHQRPSGDMPSNVAALMKRLRSVMGPSVRRRERIDRWHGHQNGRE